MNKITVKNIDINITGISDYDFVNLTDIARIVNPEFLAYVVRNWMRLRATIDFLGIWEKLNNNNFNLIEFDQIRNASGSNAFVMTATKWAKNTNAIEIKPSRGKTVKEWRENNVDKEGNRRDYASTIELAILSNLEYLNSMLINQKISQSERLLILNKESNREKELFNNNNIKSIKAIIDKQRYDKKYL